ncbi:unnamed protein product, partial [Brachionus calyciflorus]
SISSLALNFPTNKFSFFEEPVNSYLTPNQPALLKCKIENSFNAFFNCNNTPLEESNYSRIIQIENKKILSLEQNITWSQIKKFLNSSNTSQSVWCECHAILETSDKVIISKKAEVKVAYINQFFETNNLSLNVVVEQNIELICTSPEGEPRPSIYWLKNNFPITSTRFKVSSKGNLLISKVSEIDSANYTCVAENIAGKITSAQVHLVVVKDNKKFSDWSNWTECNFLSSNNCGKGFKKRFRKCFNQSLCGDVTYQKRNCYIECDGQKNLHIEHYSNRNFSQKNEIGYYWTQWSAWSMICNADCMRSRKRECKLGYKSTNGKYVHFNNDEINDFSIKTNECIGHNLEYSNCTFYCEKISNLIPSSNIPKDLPYLAILFLFLSILAIIILVVIISYLTIHKKSDSLRFENGYLENLNDHYTNPMHFNAEPCAENNNICLNSLCNHDLSMNENYFESNIDPNTNTYSFNNKVKGKLKLNKKKSNYYRNIKSSDKINYNFNSTSSTDNENSNKICDYCSNELNPKVIETNKNNKLNEGMQIGSNVYWYSIFNNGDLYVKEDL